LQNTKNNENTVHGVFHVTKKTIYIHMKKVLSLISLTVLFSSLSFAQTATNFNCNDCASINHDLFSELDAGKIIVLTWVMPCSACIAPSLTASTTVQGYASSNPGVVKFYLADDYANTICSSLTGWATTNGLVTNAVFSDASIDMLDYGTAGMPKTVVLGGTSHTVYYNQNGSNVMADLQTAINSALTAGISEVNKNSVLGLKVFPNPVKNTGTLYYTLTASENVSMEIIDHLGQQVSSVSIGKQAAGKHEYQFNMETLSNGVYFIRLTTGEVIETIKLTVTH
jgi:hypothetical protein